MSFAGSRSDESTRVLPHWTSCFTFESCRAHHSLLAPLDFSRYSICLCPTRLPSKGFSFSTLSSGSLPHPAVVSGPSCCPLPWPRHGRCWKPDTRHTDRAGHGFNSLCGLSSRVGWLREILLDHLRRRVPWITAAASTGRRCRGTGGPA